MLFGKSNEVNKRQVKIEFIALKYTELLQHISKVFKFMDASYISMFQEHIIYMYDREYNIQDENTYKMIKNNLDKLTEEELSNEKINLLKEEIEYLMKETPPIYMQHEQLKVKSKENNLTTDKKWSEIKIDRDMLGKKFKSKDKEYVVLRLPETSKYKGNYIIAPTNLIVEKDDNLFWIMKNDANIMIRRYDNINQQFIHSSLKSSEIFRQFDEYRQYLKNNPKESYQRAIEEFKRTSKLDMEKIDDSYMFDGYQLEVMYNAFYNKLPMESFLNPKVSYIKMYEKYNELLQEKEEQEQRLEDEDGLEME
ncbi:MAG: hypothetical protein HFF36_07855 [Coprobacillus sp.]|nr:hypothetical protein [Coprobacillus sp.]